MIRTTWLLLLSILLVSPIWAETGAVRVVDPAGKPVPGAEVFYSFAYGGTSTYRSATADAEGRATVELTTQPIHRGFMRGGLAAAAPGYGVGLAMIGTEPKLEGETVVRLAPPASLSGTVVDEKGAPVAGATVGVNYIDNTNASTNTGRSYFMLTDDLAFGPPSALAARFRAITDAAGRYTLTGLPENAFVEIELDDARFTSTSVSANLFLPEAPQLVARPGAALEGRVTSDGAPVAGVRILAMLQDSWGNVAVATTEADGRYRLTGLQAAGYRIMTIPPPGLNRVAVAERASARLDQTVTVPDRKLEPGVTVEGTVRSAVTGAAIADVNVFYRSQERPRGRLPAATTDKAGRYRFLAPPGDVRMFLDIVPGHQRGDQKRLVAVAGQPLTADFSLPAAATVEGNVRDETGQPVAGFPLRVSAWWGEDTSDAGGHFWVGGLLPGEVTLSSIGPWRIVSSKRAFAPAKITITVRKRNETPFRGRVVDPAGAPVPGVIVSFVRSIEGEPYAREKLVTDADGRYETVARSGDSADVTLFKSGWKVRTRPLIDSNVELIGLHGMPYPNYDAKFTVTDAVMEKG